MRYLKYMIPFFLIALGMIACVKEYDMEDSETINPPPSELINANVYGQVIDEQNVPINGAEVTLHTHEGTEHTTTDQKGYFEFKDARLEGNSAFLKMEQHGKFDAFRRLSAIKGNWNYTRVKMLEKKFVGSISALHGGTVKTTDGAALSLPSNAVVRKNGGSYNGDVRVAMQWIDPTAEDLQERIVGDLSGIDIEGNQVALGTYGMMVVELQDESGNELELADDSNAELTYPVPDDIHGTPPQTVPMWSYDEDIGTWMEETIASYQDGAYVTEVSHFSSWNVDWKGESIEVSGNVTINGQASSLLTSFKVLVMIGPNFGSRGGYLTPDGEFLFYNFPANEEFTLKIINICGETVYEELKGPFDQDTDLGTIDISGSGSADFEIEGIALDCDNDPIDGALVQIEFENHKLYTAETDVNGAFTVTAPYCGNPIDASAVLYNPNSGKASQPQDFTIDGSNVMLGSIQVCDEPPEFVSFTIDDTDDYNVTSPPGFINLTQNSPNQDNRLLYEGSNGWMMISIDSEVNGTGTYNSSRYRFNIQGGGSGTIGGYWDPTPPDLTVEVTQYSDVPGDFIRGDFGGTVIDSLQNTHPIEGAFKVKVDE